MMSRRNSLRRDERGTATIELALFAPILAAMVIGVIDMSMAYSRKLQIEQSAQRAIEKVMQTTGETSVATTIIDEVADQANIPDSEKASKIAVNYRLECDDEPPVTSSDATTFDTYNCAEGTVHESRYIEVVVNDSYDPMFHMTFSGLDADGTYHIRATAGMRTK